MESDGEEEGGNEGEEGGGLKSQRPRRRKQAVQVARPMTWPASSACQPKRERARAEGLRGGGGEAFGGVVIVVVAGGGCMRGESFWDMEGRSNSVGAEGLGGSSEAMATRDS